jgi:hypothetical protein
MKTRLIKISPEFLMERIQGKSASLVSNLPGDAELLDIKCDLFSKQVIAVIRSNSFEDIKEAYPLPEFNLTYTIASKIEPPITIQLKTETHLIPKVETPPKTTLVSQAKSAEKKPIQTSQYTNGVAEEFSREQRKLLSFTLEGDCVLVKPTQFLKTEWDDINEVVRGIGGKWVKGDIISYWAIPIQIQ